MSLLAQKKKRETLPLLKQQKATLNRNDSTPLEDAGMLRMFGSRPAGSTAAAGA